MRIHRKLPAALRLLAIPILFSISMVLLQPMAASAGDRLEANQLVERAQLTLQSFICDDNMGAFRDLIPSDFLCICSSFPRTRESTGCASFLDSRVRGNDDLVSKGLNRSI